MESIELRGLSVIRTVAYKRVWVKTNERSIPGGKL